MKVVFAGGGTGGHFYPLIAIAEQLNDMADQEHLAEMKLYYFSDSPYDDKALLEQRIEYRYVQSGKLGLTWGFLRKLKSAFTTGFGILNAIGKLFVIYPDVVIGKGGYASVPTIIAASILRIPIILHESDTVPGRANRMLGKLATRIAVTYPQAFPFFPADKVAQTGQPIRRAALRPISEGAYEYLALQPGTPTIFVIGGSSGAQIINDVILDSLTELVAQYQIIHQTGSNNIEYVEKMATSILQGSENDQRYRPFGYLSNLPMSMTAGIADVVVTRAGSGLQEIAAWGIPAIIIPITNSNGDHQRKNAYAYAASGAGIVIEESNLTPHILISEINRILQDPKLHATMSESTRAWYNPDAAKMIAAEALSLAMEHQN